MEYIKIGVIGLGYVGLPLSRLMGTKYPVVGFDINSERVSSLIKGVDATKEVEPEVLLSVLTQENPVNKLFTQPTEAISDPSGQTGKGLYCTDEIKELENCNFYIVTVPTPIDAHKRPNLEPLYRASQSVGKILKPGDIVVYESTVYPGATEEECVPILEQYSGLEFNKDFFVGYSPERINPGDKQHTVEKILKVTSGSSPEAARKIDGVYASVITAGTHLAPTIKVAEAAKVIENAQRDINIAFVNELAMIFNRMGIDTQAVLDAAATKWNFLPFRPGLVGGHCIGVDPYYLAQKAQQYNYYPEILLAGRRINDSMGPYIASEVVKLMVKNDLKVNQANALVLGITFKENCPDVRNSKSVDVVRSLQEYGIQTTILDPEADPEEVLKEYRLTTCRTSPNGPFDAIVLTVAHDSFASLNIPSLLSKQGIVYDVKGFLNNPSYSRL